MALFQPKVTAAQSRPSCQKPLSSCHLSYPFFILTNYSRDSTCLFKAISPFSLPLPTHDKASSLTCIYIAWNRLPSPETFPIITPMDWTRGPTIGRGATATISLATASTSGELFAVKSMELSRSKLLQREQSFLSKLSCERIVKYLGSNTTCEGGTMLYNMFIEYAPGGALSDEIRRRGNRLDEARIRLYTRQIVLGLEYLHFNGLVHCDIKSENVLIREDGAVIADLGCAKSVQGNGGGSVFSGTPVFMAPEVARGEEQDFPADVWALGCTVIEMATGCNPWPEVDDPVSALYRIGFSGDVPEFPMWLSENGRDFLDKCVRRNPRERWTAKELLAHPFLEDGIEPNSKQVREFAMKSPTSVLDDQGFWDSLEAPVTPSVLTHIGSSSNSPAERIRRLNEVALSSGSNLPNWTWDEDWVTVRSNYIEESARFSDHITTASVVASFVHEEEPENSVPSDNFFFENSPENISISSSFSINKGFLLACESFNGSLVLRDSIFRVIIRTFSFASICVFSFFFFCFFCSFFHLKNF